VPAAFTSTKGFVLEDGVPLRLRLMRTVSSADSHVGDTVDFESVQEVRLNGVVVIPKGGLAFGTVTEVGRTRKMARAGSLEIELRDLRLLDGERVGLRAVEGGKGRSHVVVMTTALVASGLFFFPAAPGMLFIHGRDMVIPKGAEVTAYIAGDLTLDASEFARPPLTAPNPAIPDASAANPDVKKEGVPHGSFQGRTYVNQYFELAYRLSPEWVLDTNLAGKTLASSHEPGDLLLAAVRIPQDLTDLRADAWFRLMAVPATESATCREYVDALGASLRSRNRGKSKGEVREFSVAGHEFVRADFEYDDDAHDRSVICSPSGGFLLVWKIEGTLWESVDEAASTVYAIAPWPLASDPSAKIAPTSVSERTSTRMLRRKVAPVYPLVARENSIRGTVRLEAVIGPRGDVERLELVEGPIELATSAVTAIRQWKYRPYLLNGEPVAVTTPITISYSGE
jgi:TonB family protein